MNKHSIRSKLIFYTIATSSFITLIITASQIYMDYTNGIKEINKSQKIIETSYLKQLNYATWGLNVNQMANMVTGISHLQGISYVLLHPDYDQKIINGKKIPHNSNEKTWILKDPIHQKRIGTLLIQINYSSVYQSIIGRLFYTLGTNALKTFIVVLFMFFLIETLIIQRLEILNNFLAQFRIDSERPHKDFRTIEQSLLINRDEISQTGLKIKQMLEKISDTYQQNQNLTLDLIDTQERERQRLAKEIHDGSSQYIHASKLSVINYCRSQSQWPPELNQCLKFIDELNKELRITYSGLYPTVLLEETLTMAVEIYLENIFAPTKIEYNFTGFFPENLKAESKIHIYRIIQEITSNTVKHSEASQAGLSVEIKEDTLVLLAWDDGTGKIDKTTFADGRTHYGLANLKNRIKILEGTMKIKSGKDFGLHYIISFPLKAL